MYKIYSTLALIGLAQAHGDESDGWVASSTPLGKDAWKSCMTDADCAVDGVDISCVESYWMDLGSGAGGRARGCNPTALCSGTGAWTWGPDQFQMVCTQAQFDAGNLLPSTDTGMAVTPIKDDKLPDKQSCATSADCGAGLACFSYYLTHDEKQQYYDNGRACFMAELVELCKEDDHNIGGTMRFDNAEYEDREYSIDFDCTGYSGASYLAASLAALLAALNMF